MSMSWDNPRTLDAICFDLVTSDWPRGQNRARIQNLANGFPPYSKQEEQENGVVVNLNDLTHTRMLHDARSQYANAFLKNEKYARATTDGGPVHKRDQRSSVVTREWGKQMKQSIRFFERKRAGFGNLVLHGISPGVWSNEDDWCTKPLGVEDVLLPGETLLGFENLPFIIFRRTLTSIELYNLTRKENRDPGWNMRMVNSLMDWLEQEATVLRSLNWPEVWSPEKIAERTKQEAGGTLAGDRAPKIDLFDIYAFDDSKGTEGWVRRIILDSWSEPTLDNGQVTSSRKVGPSGDTSMFLYTSKNRKVAKNWHEIAAFSYADLSAVFPARYYSVRGLGWMLYAACHLSSRLRGKFYEAVLENLMMLFEVDSQADAQNALKLNLVNRGFIDKTIRPVKAQDRWQVNAGLVELGLRDNAQVISEQASSWMQNQSYSRDKMEKTRFQVLAEMQAATTLVSAAMNQAAYYEEIEMREIFRRFLNKNSSNAQVRAFRAACLRQDVPAYLLEDPTAWDIKVERVMGGGNKTIEMMIADWLMANRPAFDPEPQREILRRATLAYTDDPGFSVHLVPDQPVRVTKNVREAEHIATDLLNGVDVQPMTGENHIEIVSTLLRILSQRIAQGLQSGGMVSPQELQGLQVIAQHTGMRIQMIAEDPAQKAVAKSMMQVLGKAMNQIKAFAQRLQAAMKAQAQGNGRGQGIEAKELAKVQAVQLMAQTKAQVAKTSAAQRTAQRDVQFQQKLRHQLQQHQADLLKTDLEAASNIRRGRLTSLEE